MRRALFLGLLLTVVLFAEGWSQGPEEARAQLQQMGVEYNEASFIQRATRGDLAAVRLFLAAGMNPNAKDALGRTALIWAAF